MIAFATVRTRFDHFAKQLCQAALAPAGEVRVEAETEPEVQSVDLWFMPEPSKASALAQAGLLGELASEPSLFEFHHHAPGVDDVLVCLHRQLGWLLAERRRAKAETRAVPPLRRMWLLSAGRPEQAMAELGFGPMHLPGLYEAARGFRLGLVVVNELRREPSTLLLRLMGAGAVLRQAVAEVAALPRDAQLRRLALPLLVRLRFELPADASQRTPEEEEFLMSGQQLFDEFVRQTERRGLEEGLAAGIEKGLERGLEKGRLTEARRALRRVLSRRGLTLSAEQDARIEAQGDLTELERWYDQAATASSADEALC